jgi:hypothetical protein
MIVHGMGWKKQKESENGLILPQIWLSQISMKEQRKKIRNAQIFI